MRYEPVIGLEVHAQLLTRSKMFCGCSTQFGAAPNTHTCPVCLGMPGALPVLNERAVDFALTVALATRCTVSPVSRFARKNYFYPDLPKGYQISQYERPLATNGWLGIEVNGVAKRIRLKRIHLEEDAGKSFHEADGTLLDFNRCGIPLVEIVSEPDLGSPEEAVFYLRRLRDELRYLGVCGGDMETGSFRCDANVSLSSRHADPPAGRCELKNMNSFKGVRRALTYEIERQRSLLAEGRPVPTETRHWNEVRQETVAMRRKEASSDYRFFPEPDLHPLVIDPSWISRIQSRLPEPAQQKIIRFMERYGLSRHDAEILTASRQVARFFESCVEETDDPKASANWTINELLPKLKTDPGGISNCPVSPADLGRLIRITQSGTISGKMAKEIFHDMYTTGGDVTELIRVRGVQLSDQEALNRLVDEVMATFPDQCQRYLAGKKQLLHFFVGEIMKRTEGKANPRTLQRILEQRLEKG